MNNRISKLMPVIAGTGSFILMLAFPTLTVSGAQRGLLLWYNTLLPVLLPFIIVSGILLRLNLHRSITRFIYPVFGKCLGISRDGCFPAVMGLVSGMPVSAGIVSTLNSSGHISRAEGTFLAIAFNNPSIAFITGYIYSCINTKALSDTGASNIFLLPPAAAPVIILTSSVISALIIRRIIFPSAGHENASPPDFAPAPSALPLSECIDSAIMSGFESMVKIGGYCILFSIASVFIGSLPLRGEPAAILSCILEITTGISQLGSHIGIPGSVFSSETVFGFILALTAFGGLSGAMQTKSQLSGSDISFSHYLLGKLLSSIICLILYFFICRL